jgi:hypothetical protein
MLRAEGVGCWLLALWVVANGVGSVTACSAALLDMVNCKSALLTLTLTVNCKLLTYIQERTKQQEGNYPSPQPILSYRLKGNGALQQASVARYVWLSNEITYC